MADVTISMTAEELIRMPDDGMRHELVKGEHRVMTPAGSEHGRISVRLGGRLDAHCEAQRLGCAFGAETGFIIGRDPDTVRAPDAAFVSVKRIPMTGVPQGYWKGPPDLAVEVISPSDTLLEVEENVDQWLDAGTTLVWVVNPRRRTVTVYRSRREVTILSESDELDGGEVVPGFKIRVSEILA
jgi:Uma2 family endonuclease